MYCLHECWVELDTTGRVDDWIASTPDESGLWKLLADRDMFDDAATWPEYVDLLELRAPGLKEAMERESIPLIQTRAVVCSGQFLIS